MTKISVKKPSGRDRNTDGNLRTLSISISKFEFQSHELRSGRGERVVKTGWAWIYWTGIWTALWILRCETRAALWLLRWAERQWTTEGSHRHLWDNVSSLVTRSWDSLWNQGVLVDSDAPALCRINPAKMRTTRPRYVSLQPKRLCSQLQWCQSTYSQVEDRNKIISWTETEIPTDPGTLCSTSFLVWNIFQFKTKFYSQKGGRNWFNPSKWSKLQSRRMAWTLPQLKTARMVRENPKSSRPSLKQSMRKTRSPKTLSSNFPSFKHLLVFARSNHFVNFKFVVLCLENCFER